MKVVYNEHIKAWAATATKGARTAFGEYGTAYAYGFSTVSAAKACERARANLNKGRVGVRSF